MRRLCSDLVLSYAALAVLDERSVGGHHNVLEPILQRLLERLAWLGTVVRVKVRLGLGGDLGTPLGLRRVRV